MIDVAGSNLTRYGNSAETDQITAPAMSEGDLVVVWTYRSNEGSPGRPDASMAGWPAGHHIGQGDPTGTFVGVIDVMAKYAEAADETGSPVPFTIEWNEGDPGAGGGPEYGRISGVAIIPDGDLASVTLASFTEYSGQTTHAWPANTWDLMLRILGNNDNGIFQGQWPTGDTDLGFTSGDWRNAGFSKAGANTQHGTYASTKGSYCVVHVTEKATTATATPQIAAGSTLSPAVDHSTISIDVTGGGSNVTEVEYALNNLDDTLTWRGATSSWLPGADDPNSVTGLNTATPFTHPFPNGPAWLPDDTAFELKSRARTATEGWGPWTTHAFSTGAWIYATPTTWTADTGVGNTPPTITVTSHTDGQVLPAGTTTIPFAGTAVDPDGTVDRVEGRHRINGGAWSSWATATGTTSWAYTVGALVDGDLVDVELRSVDDLGALSPVAALTVGINERPTVTVTSHTDGQVLPAATVSIPLAGTAADPDGTVATVEVRHRIDAGAWSSWATATGTTSWTHTITGVAEGNTVDVEVRATDDDGDVSTVGSSTVSVNSLPTVTLTSHTNGQFLDSTETVIALTGTSADSDGTVSQVQVRYRINGAAWGSWFLASGTNPWSWTLGGVTTGDVVDFWVRATDNDGELGPILVFTIRVNDLPTAAITSHTHEQIIPSATSIPLAGTASDPDGSVALVEYRYQVNTGAGPWGSWTAATGTTSWTATIGGLSPGDFVWIEVRATDDHGEAGPSPSPIRIHIASDPPTVAVTSHTDGQTIPSATSIPLAGTASDPDGTVDRVEVRHRIDAGVWSSWATATGTTSWTHAIAVSPGDVVDIEARSVDDQENTSTIEALTVTVTNDPPTVAVTSHTDGQTIPPTGYGTTSIPLAGTASDDDTVASTQARYRVNAGPWSNWLGTGGTPTAWTFTPSALSPGDSADFEVRATDNLGATSTVVALTVNIDNDPPTVTVTSHTDLQVLPEDTTGISLAGTASDDGLLDRVEARFRVNAGAWSSWGTATGTTAWSIGLGPVTEDDSIDIEARAYDSTGLVSTVAALAVSVASSDPTLSISQPIDGATVPGPSLSVTGSASDLGGIDRVEVRHRVNAGAWSSWATASGTISWSTLIGSLSAADAIDIEAKAFDGLDNESTVASVSVTVAGEVIPEASFGISQVAAPLAPPAPRPRHRVLLTDVKSGTVIGPLPIENSVRWSDVYLGAGEISVDVPLEHPSTVLTEANLDPGRAGLWVFRDGVPLKGGILYREPDVDLVSGVAQLRAAGFHWYLTKRLIRNTFIATNEEQYVTARRLVNLAASQVGIEVPVNPVPSGVTQSRTWPWFEWHYIADALLDLAMAPDGFDFRYEARVRDTATGAEPYVEFITSYPNTGRDTDHLLILGRNCTPVSVGSDAGELTNRLISAGSGAGDATCHVVHTDGSTGRPIYEDVTQHSAVEGPDAGDILDRLGRSELRRRSEPVRRLRVSIDPDGDRGAPKIGTYEMGDRVRVRKPPSKFGWWTPGPGDETLYRIVRAETTAMPGSEETLLDLVPLSSFLL